MHLFGIGIDVVETARVQSSIDEFGEKFLNRIFTEAEREYCEKHKKSILHFAARFAAKEAVAKALGTGIGKEMAFKEIQVEKKASGEPTILLTGSAKAFAEKNNISLIKVSISHAEHYAAANAVVMQNS